MNGMIMSLIGTFTPIMLSLLSMMAFSAVIILKSQFSTRTKILYIPLALFSAVYVPYAFSLLLGFAYPHQLPDKFVYIAHKTIVKENKKTNIEVWAGFKTDTRLFLIPYDKMTEKQMQQAQQDTQNGKRVEMSRKGKKTDKKGQSADADEYPYSAQSLSPSEMNPKDAEPASPPANSPSMTPRVPEPGSSRGLTV